LKSVGEIVCSAENQNECRKVVHVSMKECCTRGSAGTERLYWGEEVVVEKKGLWEEENR
jgi:hypothetical protein